MGEIVLLGRSKRPLKRGSNIEHPSLEENLLEIDNI
jgi:hypothetical protein